MSTQLIFTDPKLAKLVDKIKQLLRNRKSINEVQFSWCVRISVRTHVRTKTVKKIYSRFMHFAEKCTSRIITQAQYTVHSNSTGHLKEQYILIRQVISKNRFIFSMQISFQNLTSCRRREKDGLHDPTKYLFFNRTAAV